MVKEIGGKLGECWVQEVKEKEDVIIELIISERLNKKRMRRIDCFVLNKKII